MRNSNNISFGEKKLSNKASTILIVFVFRGTHVSVAVFQEVLQASSPRVYRLLMEMAT